MAGSRTTFNKRQKERARQERQAQKAQKRAERRNQQSDETPVTRTGEAVQITYDEEGRPQGLDFHDF